MSALFPPLKDPYPRPCPGGDTRAKHIPHRAPFHKVTVPRYETHPLTQGHAIRALAVWDRCAAARWFHLCPPGGGEGTGGHGVRGGEATRTDGP